MSGSLERAVDRLPMEILEEIFLYSLSDTAHIQPIRPAIPLFLTHVCSTWRHTAVSMPRLWVSHATFFTSQNITSRMALLDLWLSRSTHHSVSLSVYIPSSLEGDILPLFNLLRHHLHRLHFLRLTLPVHLHRMLHASINNGAPALQFLQVRFTPSELQLSSDPGTESLVFNPTSFPRLHDLAWGHPDRHVLPLSLHTSSLTNLTVGYAISIKESMDILSQCSRLRSCHFKQLGGCGNPYPIVDPPPILLPELESLVLASTEPISPLLRAMTVPRLRAFAAADAGRFITSTIWPQADFEEMLTRSQCSIQHLRLLNVLQDGEQLFQCLRLTSKSLVQLQLSDSKAKSIGLNQVLQELSLECDVEEDILCPNLQVLELGRSLSPSTRAMAKMVLSRRRRYPTPRPCLRSIMPRLSRITFSRDSPILLEVQKKGILVQIT